MVLLSPVAFLLLHNFKTKKNTKLGEQHMHPGINRVLPVFLLDAVKELRYYFLNLCLNLKIYFWLCPWSPVTSRSFIHRWFSALSTDFEQFSSHCLALQATFKVLIFYLVLPTSSDLSILLSGPRYIYSSFLGFYTQGRFCIPELLNLLNLKTFMKSNSWNILPDLK